MRVVLALGVLLAICAVAAAYLVSDPFGDGSNTPSSLHLTGTACERLAELGGYLAAKDGDVDDFLLDLGQQAGGISKGRRALVDLARGGRNRIPGKGFKHRFDDGSIGQVRHFVGYVRASMFGGANVTRWISVHLRHDPPDSPDGRLGDQGIEFAQNLIRGDLELDGASEWLRTHLCRSPRPAGG